MWAHGLWMDSIRAEKHCGTGGSHLWWKEQVTSSHTERDWETQGRKGADAHLSISFPALIQWRALVHGAVPPYLGQIFFS